MTLAVRLRCTCRRTVATFDHGAEWIEPAKRAELLSAPIETERKNPLIAAWADQLSSCLWRCANCNHQLTYSATEFENARQRAQVTGKAIDIMPTTERRHGG